jgi:hypothetical protein
MSAEQCSPVCLCVCWCYTTRLLLIRWSAYLRTAPTMHTQCIPAKYTRASESNCNVTNREEPPSPCIQGAYAKLMTYPAGRVKNKCGTVGGLAMLLRIPAICLFYFLATQSLADESKRDAGTFPTVASETVCKPLCAAIGSGQWKSFTPQQKLTADDCARRRFCVVNSDPTIGSGVAVIPTTRDPI